MTIDAFPEVLKPYLDEAGRITRLPAKYSKKVTLSRWLLTFIEPGRRYSEKEISDLFEEYVADFALMRRMLVDSGELMRETDGSAYWRA